MTRLILLHQLRPFIRHPLLMAGLVLLIALLWGLLPILDNYLKTTYFVQDPATNFTGWYWSAPQNPLHPL